MKFAVSVPNFGAGLDARAVGELAVTAEQAGWDGFFLWDHLFAFSPGRVDTVDPWVALTVAAMSTSRIRLGTAVTPLPRRRPVVLARQTVTLDVLSAGRLVLGVGTGAMPFEWEWCGEEPDARTRGDMLDEGLELVAALWTGEPVRHHGKHYRVSGDGDWTGLMHPGTSPTRPASSRACGGTPSRPCQRPSTSPCPGRQVPGMPPTSVASPATEQPARRGGWRPCTRGGSGTRTAGRGPAARCSRGSPRGLLGLQDGRLLRGVHDDVPTLGRLRGELAVHLPDRVGDEPVSATARHAGHAPLARQEDHGVKLVDSRRGREVGEEPRNQDAVVEGEEVIAGHRNGRLEASDEQARRGPIGAWWPVTTINAATD